MDVIYRGSPQSETTKISVKDDSITAVELVRAVGAVVVPVADPLGLDARRIAALAPHAAARVRLAAIPFVLAAVAVRVPVANLFREKKKHLQYIILSTGAVASR